jgi:glycosyltransferase involved in cell wall biosynthesis
MGRFNNKKKQKQQHKQQHKQQQQQQQKQTQQLTEADINKLFSNKNMKTPFVSICTPTFNRRPFFEYTIKCYLSQDYLRDKLEWIIIDDGSDPIGDLVKDIPGVKYFYYPEKMTLGKKRNLMHEKSKGDIIVYMDDDDYYPPERVSHAVQVLQQNKNALCVGSSEIYIYFKHIQKMYQFGPYGKTHATAGTFAFKRELLNITKYNETAALAEEKEFLKNYTIPFAQLDPKKTILCFSHEHNTFDKRKLLNNPHPSYVKESNKTVEEFIKDADIRDFYMNRISKLLEDYEPGLPKYKPDVLKQTKEIEERRKKMTEERNANASIFITDNSGNKRQLTSYEIVEMMKKQQSQLETQNKFIQNQNNQLQQLKNIINQLYVKYNELQQTHNKLLQEKGVIRPSQTSHQTPPQTPPNTPEHTDTEVIELEIKEQ